MTEQFRFDADGETLTALVYRPVKPMGTTLLLGHGVSAGQRDRFVREYASGLAERGVLVVTYDFPFMEHGRGRADKDEVLTTACRAAIVAARQCRPKNELFIGGKSLGGRVAAEVAALGGDEVDDVAGLVLLGYPVHPIGKSGTARARMLTDLRIPVLIVQGTRDVFGAPKELRSVVERLPRGSELHVVEGGDHSFAVARGGPLSRGEIHAEVQDEIARWIMAVTSIAPRPKAPVRAPTRRRPIASHLGTQLRMLRRGAAAGR